MALMALTELWSTPPRSFLSNCTVVFCSSLSNCIVLSWICCLVPLKSQSLSVEACYLVPFLFFSFPCRIIVSHSSAWWNGTYSVSSSPSFSWGLMLFSTNSSEWWYCVVLLWDALSFLFWYEGPSSCSFGSRHSSTSCTAFAESHLSLWCLISSWTTRMVFLHPQRRFVATRLKFEKKSYCLQEPKCCSWKSFSSPGILRNFS